MIDLSKPKAGMIWELNQLHARGLLSKCMFGVNEDSEAEAEFVMNDFFKRENRPPVYSYRFDEALRSDLKLNLVSDYASLWKLV